VLYNGGLTTVQQALAADGARRGDEAPRLKRPSVSSISWPEDASLSKEYSPRSQSVGAMRLLMNPAVVGCASGIVLWLLALLCTGGGHGTYLPIAVFGSPLSFVPGVWLVSPLLVWSLGGVVVARRWRLASVVMFVLHATGVAAALALGTPFEGPREQWSYLANAMRQVGVMVLAAFILYGLGIATMAYLASRRSPASGLTTG
jgi:hypothetical protein